MTVIKSNEGLRCMFIVKSKDGNSRCNLLFGSKNQLDEHKKQVGHSKKRNVQKSKNNKEKKQLKIDQMIGEVDEEEGTDGDENCEICKF